MISLKKQRKYEAAERREKSIGKNVTNEEQQFFNELSKILKIEWDGDKIVNSEATISPPYDANSITFPQNVGPESQARMKKYIVDKWNKIKASQK